MSDGNLWIGLYPASAAATLLAQNEPGAESAERLQSTLSFFGKRSAADTEWIARIIAPLAAAQPPVDSARAPRGPSRLGTGRGSRCTGPSSSIRCG